jgi:hypothetical protein
MTKSIEPTLLVFMSQVMSRTIGWAICKSSKTQDGFEQLLLALFFPPLFSLCSLGFFAC